MKVNELAKELKIKSKDVLKMLNNLGTHHDHHSQDVADDIAAKVRHNFQVLFEPPKKEVPQRTLLGINNNGKNFSVLKIGYTGGDFSEKIRNIASQLKVDVVDLEKALKDNGYPVLLQEITEDINYKSEAVIKLRKEMYNTEIQRPEEINAD